MGQDAFKKFINPKKNSVVKEEIRQDKKKARKEKREYFETKKAEEYKARQAKKGIVVKEKAAPAPHPSSDPSKRPIAKSTAKTPTTTDKKQLTTEVVMPLNKFLAHCGVCSRRDAVTIITQGSVKVNGEVATEPGYKVQP
ncbi:MAG: S4 domain-containing protein, partial [Ferruginibacter sp.]